MQKKRRVLPAVIPIRLHLHTARYAQGGCDGCQNTDDDVDNSLPGFGLDLLAHESKKFKVNFFCLVGRKIRPHLA